MNHTRTALYYPEIIIPSKQFIRKTILYWDDIGSIVPKPIWDEHPYFELEDKETNLLRNAGLYRPFFPHTLRGGGVGDFETKFKDEFFRRLDHFNQQNHLKNNIQYTPVYEEKEMVMGLFNELEQRGLGKRKLAGQGSVSKFKQPVYFIESVTANIYMALLAESLADADSNITMPVTEASTWQDYAYAAIDPQMKKVCANLILDRILPIPAADVPLERIIQFKEDHKTELLKFRECIDNFQSSIPAAGDVMSVRDSCCRFTEQFNLGVRDIEQSLKNRNIETIFGSIQAILDVKSPDISSTLLGTGALALGAIQPIFLLSGVAMYASIKVERYLLKERSERTKWFNSLPYSYVYHLGMSNIAQR
jgi:hypothetical protein